VLPLISDFNYFSDTKYIYEAFVQVAAAETVTGCVSVLLNLLQLCAV